LKRKYRFGGGESILRKEEIISPKSTAFNLSNYLIRVRVKILARVCMINERV
jgi:hypothetical protein